MGLLDAAGHLVESYKAFRESRRKLDDPCSADDVLSAERNAIADARRAKNLDEPPQFQKAQPDYIGLSFSGGGIRSATFNLGILQGLARRGLLPHIDYLSTVSGGGYVGSWLVAWIKRRAEPDPKRPDLAPNANVALERVQELLCPDQAYPDSIELEPIRNLRRYSNYLTPSASLFSADVWTMVAIWFRNTLLNLTIIVCLITVLLLPSRFIGLWLKEWRRTLLINIGPWSMEAVVAVIALLAVSFWISRNLRQVLADARPPDDQHRVQWLILAPAIIGAASAASWMYRTPQHFIDNWSSWAVVILSLGFAPIPCLGEFPRALAARISHQEKPGLRWRALGYCTSLMLSILTGFVAAALLYGIARAVDAIARYSPDWRPWIVGSLAPPAVLIAAALGLAVQVALAGRAAPDSLRTWLGRLRAWSIIYGGLDRRSFDQQRERSWKHRRRFLRLWAGLLTVALFALINLGPWPVEAVISVVALLVASFYISSNIQRVSRRARQAERKASGERVSVDSTPTHDQERVQWFVLVPATIGSAAVATWMYREPEYFTNNWSSWVTLVLSVGFAVITCLGEFPSGFAARLAHHDKPALKWRVLGYVVGLFFSVLTGFATAAMLYGVTRAIGAISSDHRDWVAWIVVSFGPPAVLVVSALGLALQIGLVGRDVPDTSREWLGRLRAWAIIYGGIWAGVFAVSLFGPWLLYSLGAWAGAAGGGWLLTTIAGLFAGNSERTAGDGAKGVQDRAKELVATVAPYVFMAGVFVLVSWGIHELVSDKLPGNLVHMPGPSATLAGTPEPVRLTVGAPTGVPFTHFEARIARYAHDLAFASPGISVGFPSLSWTLGADNLGNVDLYNLTMLLLTAIIAGGILAWRVDINEFSMHQFYKNRLVRCYLGASRRRRMPDAFTGFDGGDDYPLAGLRPVGRMTADERKDIARTIYCGPYPIVNAALNITGGNSLAWQERQAASYVFTPLFSGYDRPLVDRETGGGANGHVQYAYRPTDQCGYVGGIGAGQAMAISGAAASPNSGFHTSTAVAFFLTVLNARLGWWLGNPSLKDAYKRSSPTFGLAYLLVELFGVANTQKKYVNLSDGGHFDNLGIYELVRRRCKYVIACDGEQDSDMTFGGLAGVIRKCRTDFGAEIEINVDQLRKNAQRLSLAHCVVGTITYDNGQQGCLVYLKSSLTGNEDPDVLEYRSRNKEFPHQSTSDQWFDESEFESYRRLGLHVAESAFGGIEPLARRLGRYEEKKAGFFDDLELRHHPRSKLITEFFTRHSGALTGLLETFVKNENFTDLDDSVLSEWTPLSSDEHARDFERGARFWCNSIIQLMENVYVDLDLDDLKEQQHPDNAGWLLLFKRWSVSPVFRRTWAIVGSAYGKRFQRFFRQLQVQAGARLTGQWDCDAKEPPDPLFKSLTLSPVNNGHWDLKGSVIDADGRATAITDLDYNGVRVIFKVGDQRYRFTLEAAAEPKYARFGRNDRLDETVTFRRVKY